MKAAGAPGALRGGGGGGGDLRAYIHLLVEHDTCAPQLVGPRRASVLPPHPPHLFLDASLGGFLRPRPRVASASW